jgi:hypothetical protein
LNIEVLNISKMASGNLCLDLTEKINWEDFASYANSLVNILNGEIISKTVGFDLIIWEISVNGESFRLVFDDFPVMVTLESSSEQGDEQLLKIKDYLMQIMGSGIGNNPFSSPSV